MSFVQYELFTFDAAIYNSRSSDMRAGAFEAQLEHLNKLVGSLIDVVLLKECSAIRAHNLLKVGGGTLDCC